MKEIEKQITSLNEINNRFCIELINVDNDVIHFRMIGNICKYARDAYLRYSKTFKYKCISDEFNKFIQFQKGDNRIKFKQYSKEF